MAVWARVAHRLSRPVSRHYHGTAAALARGHRAETQGSVVFSNGKIPQEKLFSHVEKLNLKAVNETTHGDERAMVVLASPQHAKLVTDIDVMSQLINKLRDESNIDSSQTNLHVLGAVVDGIAPYTDHVNEFQEGVSIAMGDRSSLLPGLWETSPDVMQNGQAEEQPAHLTFFNAAQHTAADAVSVTLPLSNTLFLNGRRSTLMASEWGPVAGGNKEFQLRKMVSKNHQIIRIRENDNVQRETTTANEAKSDEHDDDRLLAIVRAQLLPITKPRRIVEGLGNIVAKVEIDAAPAPASAELQNNMNRLLANDSRGWRQLLEQGPLAAWAVVIPSESMGLVPGKAHDAKAVQDALSNFETSIGVDEFSPASRLLAPDMKSNAERRPWRKLPMLSRMLNKGARLHRILSGGGEWGAKASLLALDPQTSWEGSSEEEELQRFQQSLQDGTNAAESIVRPGDFVQYFVACSGPSGMLLLPRNAESDYKFPGVNFGVRDRTLSLGVEKEKDDHGQAFGLPGSFWATTSEALYVHGGGLNTKLDTPWTTAALTSAAKVRTQIGHSSLAKWWTSP